MFQAAKNFLSNNKGPLIGFTAGVCTVLATQGTVRAVSKWRASRSAAAVEAAAAAPAASK